jgi:hypothetical protein
VNQIKVCAKTFAAFFAAVVGNMVVNLVNGTAPWPQSSTQWVQFAVTSFGAAIATWATPNKITQKQIDKSASDAPVVNPSPPPAAGEFKDPWT